MARKLLFVLPLVFACSASDRAATLKYAGPPCALVSALELADLPDRVPPEALVAARKACEALPEVLAAGAPDAG